MPRIALVAAALIVSGLSMRAAPETVTVDGGQIAGAVDRGVRVFKGIPFAAPPVGPLRWRPPQPVVAWSGARDASAFGAECPQAQYPAGSLYYFRHVPPSPRAKELKAFHAGEIPYVFNVVPSQDRREAGFTCTAVDTRLADAMSSYWVNFVETGDPNGPGLPAWPVYNRNDEPYLEFGDTIAVGHHLLKRELDFQERVRSGP